MLLIAYGLSGEDSQLRVCRVGVCRWLLPCGGWGVYCVCFPLEDRICGFMLAICSDTDPKELQVGWLLSHIPFSL